MGFFSKLFSPLVIKALTTPPPAPPPPAPESDLLGAGEDVGLGASGRIKKPPVNTFLDPSRRSTRRTRGVASRILTGKKGLKGAGLPSSASQILMEGE